MSRSLLNLLAHNETVSCRNLFDLLYSNSCDLYATFVDSGIVKPDMCHVLSSVSFLTSISNYMYLFQPP
jgi:hypothetical protein